MSPGQRQSMGEVNNYVGDSDVHRPWDTLRGKHIKLGRVFHKLRYHNRSD